MPFALMALYSLSRMSPAMSGASMKSGETLVPSQSNRAPADGPAAARTVRHVSQVLAVSGVGLDEQHTTPRDMSGPACPISSL